MKNRKKTTKVEKEKPTVPAWFTIAVETLLLIATWIELIWLIFNN